MPTGLFGPIPPGIVGLLLGRSTLTSKGVTVHTGVIDSDYEGEIQIIMSSSVPWTTQKGERVTQLLLLPSTLPGKRGTGGFGSTGEAGIFLAEKISAIHPVCQIAIQSKRFTGLSDTGTRVSIIGSQEWPKNWKVQEPNINLVGVGLHSPLSGQRDKRDFYSPILWTFQLICGVKICLHNGKQKFGYHLDNIVLKVNKL